MKNLLIIILALALTASIMSDFLKADAAGEVTFNYAYDSQSIHEKIDGDLEDIALDKLVYILIIKNPHYVEGAPNSGEWYIIKLKEVADGAVPTP